MQGFDKTSDALDTVSSEIQMVVSSGMEEEVHSPVQKTEICFFVCFSSSVYDENHHLYLFIQDYSSSSLDAASSCTIDLGETCSSNIPGITQLLVLFSWQIFRCTPS